ncbi:MAG: hypothetical protein U0L49_00445 [Eubacterium sp.]|nr:hypothetical protein [Eubacterium sp.]
MEHHPFLSFEDGLEITYSDIKQKKSGSEYVTIYFEKPNQSGDDFDSAQCDYPGGAFTHIVGFTKEELSELWEHVAKVGMLTILFQKEKRYA